MSKENQETETTAATKALPSSSGSVPHYEGKSKAGYTEEQKRLAYEIWKMLEDGKTLSEVNQKRRELNRILAQNANGEPCHERKRNKMNITNKLGPNPTTKRSSAIASPSTQQKSPRA